MPAIPNTMRRGAIYWFRRSRRLPDGNLLRPTVSLRTAVASTARLRAAILSARFEELYMRLFGNPGRRFALDADAARRVFQREFSLALDAIEDEREQACLPDYTFRDLPTFLEVHEEIYRFLSEEGCTGDEVTTEMLYERLPHLDSEALGLVHGQLRSMGAIWYHNLDETAASLEAEGIDTDIFHMDHALRLRFEARLAAVREFRRQLTDPADRHQRLLRQATMHATPSRPPAVAPAPIAVAAVPHRLATLTPTQFAETYIADNPKLSGAGKREGKWTDKTRSQFETAMRLLEKSMGPKPFVDLSNDDLIGLLAHFDGLPPNHHKTPRHGPMTLQEICDEAEEEVRAGRRDREKLGLNIPTLNRHFRFIRMAHEWLCKQAPDIRALDWKAFSFEDERTAREQRDAFPVDLARKLFRLPPWHGCANRRQRFKPGREIILDSTYWVILIVWYSGMRRGEACKLLATDVVQDGEGIWHFIVDDTEAGRIKTSSSRRRIPLANELIRLGLPEFVAAQRAKGESLLFPELTKNKHVMGETFYRHCWVKVMRLLDAESSGLTLHSMRHTVSDELKAAGVPEEVRADLLGHALESETAGRYSKASRLAILKEAVDLLPVVTRSLQRPICQGVRTSK